jgi:hypothetical protein
MGAVVNINDLLAEHVGLDLECLDRLYLNGYVPTLQVGGQVVRFLTQHLGNPIPSAAVFEQIGNRFRRAVTLFSERRGVPLVRFTKGERKVDRMKPFYARAKAPGVVAIGVAQEFQWVATSYTRPKSTPQSAPRFDFQRAQRRVSVYYFYIEDPDWGPGFIKICSYFPYPIKLWLNGHEWAKRVCHERGGGIDVEDRDRPIGAAPEMEVVGPPQPPCRGRLQTTASCVGQEPGW